MPGKIPRDMINSEVVVTVENLPALTVGVVGFGDAPLTSALARAARGDSVTKGFGDWCVISVGLGISRFFSVYVGLFVGLLVSCLSGAAAAVQP